MEPESLIEGKVAVDAPVVDLSGDGGVLKQVLVENLSGEGPPKDAATVRVHYIGRFADGSEFDNSYKRKVPLTFRLGQEMAVKGWDVVLPTMRVGEKCLVKLQSAYGFGTEGSVLGGTMVIPPNTDLEYDLELVSFENAIDTIPDRITAANKKKDEGNQFFKEGKYKEAINAYDQGLYFFEHVFPKSDTPDYDAVSQCKLPMFLNLAACHIKEQNWSDARLNCEKSLDIDERNVKAIFRRGQAHQGAGNYEKARSDFKKAIELDPKSLDLQRALVNLDKQEAAYKAKEKDVYSKMFK